jgi:hypothetical protein
MLEPRQESVWLIWFEGSSCDCLLMQAASLFDVSAVSTHETDWVG